MRDLGIVAIFMTGGVLTLALLTLSRPVEDQSLVIFAPGESRAFEHVIQSGGRPVRDGLFPWLLIVQHDDRQDFAARVRSRGAWAVTDPVIAGGCAFTGPRQRGLARFMNITETETNNPIDEALHGSTG